VVKKVIQPTSYYYVEFGFDAANFRGGGGANVGYMKHVLNWSGLLMDGGHANEELNLKKEFIYPENVAELFEKYDVPKVMNACHICFAVCPLRRVSQSLP
jgi:hypothetical protein